MTSEPLTPDEDAVLGEIIGTGNQWLSKERITEVATRCNMSYERTWNALAALHDKGYIYIPMPGEKK